VAFKPDEDVDVFTLHLSTLMQQMAWYVDDNHDEEKVVEKFLRVVPKKYTQVALAIKTLLDFSELTIEEVTGHLKAIDDHMQLPPSKPITIGPSFSSLRSNGSPARRSGRRGGFELIERPQAPTAQEGQGQGTPGAWRWLLAALTASARPPRMTSASTLTRHAIGPRTVDRRSAADRHTSRKCRRVMSRLCS
jgi:hypothetical protein